MDLGPTASLELISFVHVQWQTQQWCDHLAHSDSISVYALLCVIVAHSHFLSHSSEWTPSLAETVIITRWRAIQRRRRGRFALLSSSAVSAELPMGFLMTGACCAAFYARQESTVYELSIGVPHDDLPPNWSLSVTEARSIASSGIKKKEFFLLSLLFFFFFHCLESETKESFFWCGSMKFQQKIFAS